MNHIEEQQIIAAVLDGDADAYAMLINRYQQPIFNMVYRVTGSHADAADLAQDAFIKAYEQLSPREEVLPLSVNDRPEPGQEFSSEK
jgi:RNA polymerase sigma-70 factor, ECF subfamily